MTTRHGGIREGQICVEGGVGNVYLCDFDIVNLEFGVWMRLLCVEDLLDGDGSECVFAVCSLNKIISRR